MQQEFGRARVFNGPIAEDFITGTADGFSRFDPRIRVVVEGAEFADYFWPAAEQLIELSHEYWRTRGQYSPNITIRLASGGYIGGGLYHSQNIEAWLTSIPGIRVVVPAFADDAAGLLRTCLRSPGREPVPGAQVPVQLRPGQGLRARPSSPCRSAGRGCAGRAPDLTVLAYGTPVHFALEAARKLEAEGVGVEVVDLRSLNPLDTETIFASVRKTHRALVVHEDKVFGGFGGEVAAQVGQECFPWLDAPVGRVGSAFTPVGFNRILERAILPNTEKVLEGMRKVLAF